MSDILIKPDSVPDMSELEPFETENSNVPMRPMQLSFERCVVAQKLAFEGKTQKKISEETGIPVTTIARWLRNAEFVAYKNKLILEAADHLKAENLSLLTKIVQARVQKIEDAGGDYSALSDKDTASLIETMHSLTKEDKKEDESNYSKKLEELLLKSSQKNVIDISPKGGN